MKKQKLDQVRTMMKKVWFYDLVILQKNQQTRKEKSQS